jgi:hypothetical protein
MAINPRVKGHAFELKIRDFFRELGWTKSVSSRSESKNKDDSTSKPRRWRSSGVYTTS